MLQPLLPISPAVSIFAKVGEECNFPDQTHTHTLKAWSQEVCEKQAYNGKLPIDMLGAPMRFMGWISPTAQGVTILTTGLVGAQYNIALWHG